jgi:hypothetical protein
LWTMCPGWLWTAILLFSASCVARIIGMSYWCPAFLFPVVRSAQVASWLLTWAHKFTKNRGSLASLFPFF